MQVTNLHFPREEKCNMLNICILTQLKHYCFVYFRELMILVTGLNIYYFLPIYLKLLKQRH